MLQLDSLLEDHGTSYPEVMAELLVVAKRLRIPESASIAQALRVDVPAVDCDNVLQDTLRDRPNLRQSLWILLNAIYNSNHLPNNAHATRSYHFLQPGERALFESDTKYHFEEDKKDASRATKRKRLWSNWIARALLRDPSKLRRMWPPTLGPWPEEEKGLQEKEQLSDYLQTHVPLHALQKTLCVLPFAQRIKELRELARENSNVSIEHLASTLLLRKNPHTEKNVHHLLKLLSPGTLFIGPFFARPNTHYVTDESLPVAAAFVKKVDFNVPLDPEFLEDLQSKLRQGQSIWLPGDENGVLQIGHDASSQAAFDRQQYTVVQLLTHLGLEDKKFKWKDFHSQVVRRIAPRQLQALLDSRAPSDEETKAEQKRESTREAEEAAVKAIMQAKENAKRKAIREAEEAAVEAILLAKENAAALQKQKDEAEEAARIKEEEAARKSAEQKEEEARRSDDAARKEEEEARRSREDEAARKEEEEARREEEEARRSAEDNEARGEEEARRSAEHDAAHKEEEEDDAAREEEEEARRTAEDDAAREEEDEARRIAEEEERRDVEEKRNEAPPRRSTRVHATVVKPPGKTRKPRKLVPLLSEPEQAALADPPEHLQFWFEKDQQKIFSCELKCYRCPAILSDKTQCPRVTCYHVPYCYYHMRTILSLEIRASTIPNAGRGLFALRPFKSEEVIVEFVGEAIMTTQDSTAREKLSQRYGAEEVTAPYAIKVHRDAYIDAACIRGIASFANDFIAQEGRHNAEYVIQEEKKTSYKLELRARKTTDQTDPIQAGDEIFVDYGKPYWKGETGTPHTSEPDVNVEFDPTAP